MAHPLQSVKDHYDKLCAERDATYAKVDPLEKELNKINAEIGALQAKANAFAAKIEDSWGGAGWISKKKEIAKLARALSGSGLL